MRTYEVNFRYLGGDHATGHHKVRAHDRQHAIYMIYLDNREKITNGELDYFNIREKGIANTASTVILKKPDAEPRYQTSEFWKNIEDLLTKMDSKEDAWLWWVTERVSF